MKRWKTEPTTPAVAGPGPASRPASRRVAGLALLLVLVSGVASGCILVPVGYGHDHGRHGGYHGRGFDRDDRYRHFSG
jgi:hypothetical protein